jgi:hypothetical protein
MNEIERRALLGAAGIGAMAAMAKAGPLNPPGSVSSTGRTLDEIYNKIPPVGGTDGRVPISTAGSILNPGSYVLTANIDIATPGFTTLFISANNVTLDLNGFRVSSTGGGVCLAVIGVVSNIIIRNGTTFGGQFGLLGDNSGVRGLLIEDLRVYNPRFGGISIPATTARDCIIRRCEVSECGVTTTAADVNAVVAGIGYSGSAGRIEECSVHTLANNGSGTLTSRGIYLPNGSSTGNLVSRCHLGNSGGVAGAGINIAAASSVFRDNTVSGYSTAYSGGFNGGGNV